MAMGEGGVGEMTKEELVKLVNDVCDIFQIGSAARTPSTILTNVSNASRRSACLSAVEREFCTHEVPDEDGIEGETVDVCDVSWGADPAQYVEQFRAALLAARGRS